MISNSLYLIRCAMISTFVLWTPCEAVYMFLTAVQKLKTLSKTKKRGVWEKRSSLLFLSKECIALIRRDVQHAGLAASP